MNETIKELYAHWQQARSFWQGFRRAFSHYVKVQELSALIRWAERKKLTGPARSYCRQLVEPSNDLFRCMVRQPELCWLLPFAYEWRLLLRPEPRYWPKGSASRYRRNMRSRGGLGRFLRMLIFGSGHGTL